MPWRRPRLTCLFGCLIQAGPVEHLPGDCFCADADRAVAGPHEQSEVRPNVPAGAFEEVVRVAQQHPGTVICEDEPVFAGLEQAPPVPAAFVGVETERLDTEPGPAAGGLGQGHVLASQAVGEEPPLSQADADIDERDRQLVGEPLEVVGHCQAIAAVQVDEVDVVDDAELGLAGKDAVQGVTGQGCRVRPVGGRVAEVLADHPVQGSQGGVRGKADAEDGDAFVSGLGDRGQAAHLLAVEVAAEQVGDGGLAQARQGVDDGG